MKYSVVKQHDEKDCGAACVATIADHYGFKTDFHNFVRMTDTDQDGTNMNALVEASKKLGFEAEGLQGTLEEMLSEVKNGGLRCPFIAHFLVEEKVLHFVVVYEIDKEHCVIGDPAKGVTEMTTEEFSKSWTGAIVSLVPNGEFKKGNYKRNKLLTVLGILRKNLRQMTVVLILSMVIVMIGILGTFVFQITIDGFKAGYAQEEAHVHEHEEEEEGEIVANTLIDKLLLKAVDLMDQFSDFLNMKNFNLIFLCLLILYLLCSCMSYLRGRLLIYVARCVDANLGEMYYEHVVNLSVSASAEKKTGEFLTRFSDLSTIRRAISRATVAVVLDAVMVILCGVILWLYNRTLFLISASLIVFYVIVALCFRRPLARANQRTMEGNAIFESYFKESIEGKELIKATGSQGQIKEKLHALFERFLDATVKNGKVEIAQDTLCTSIESIGMVAVLWVGFWLVKSEALTIGALVTFYMLKNYFTEPIKNILSLQPTIQTAAVALERLFDVMDMETEKIDPVGDTELTPWKKLSVKGVGFEYRNRYTILEDLSLEVKQGEKIALVGESGCGKTTLARLLMGFYEPTEGEIIADERPYGQISKEEIRKRIGYVSQNAFFFTDSVRNNLKCGNDAITDEEIIRVSEECKLGDLIRELPYGLDTPLDENGGNLSAGQKQRLAFLQAILRKPQILIMDEVTANLDTITERTIRDYVFGQKELTCIIIAHRLSTIRQCDRIYVMSEGTVKESGTHEELLGKKGLYHEMVMEQ